MARVKWIDLSAVGVHLGSYRDASQQQAGVALLDPAGCHHDAIVRMGFRPASGPFSKGLYLKSDSVITPAQLRAAFGDESVRFFVAERAEINRTFSERVKEVTRVNSNALFAQQRALGLNHHGEIVYESINGRYVVRGGDGKAELVAESPEQPAAFLRAVDNKALRDICRGFVMRIRVRRESLRREHVVRLMDVSNVAEFSARAYQEAIEVAANELLAQELEQALATGERTERLAAYDIANAIYVGMPELKERTANSIANQQYSTPIPMAALAQAMLAPRDDLHGANVLDPTIGNGNLVAGLAAGLKAEEACKVYGMEIDPERVAQIEGRFAQVILGDAAEADYRKQFGLPDGFDFVIANPPFGSLDAKRDVPLPAGSKVASMETARLDHLILLKALHARRNEGRAVFITGADSAIGNGEVKGRSRHLLNYLHDHYEVEGVVDVSGDLYKKQGAQFPLRLYVVGARRAEPIEADVSETLPVIRTYEGLRDWAERIVAKQAGMAVNVRDLLEGGESDAALRQAADDYGKGVIGYAGVVPDGAALPDDWMPAGAIKNRLGELFAKHGAAFAFQIKPGQDKPFRVLRALSKDGAGVGSQWAATAAEAVDMVLTAADVMRGDRAEVTAGRAVKFGSVDLPQARAVVVTETPFNDLPEGWVVMNAPRPLLGQRTGQGDFAHGRHFAALDPAEGEFSVSFYARNIADDARVAFVASRDEQLAMAVQTIPQEYRDAYMAMDAEQRQRVLQPFVAKLNDRTYGELVELAAQASAGLDHGATQGVTPQEGATTRAEEPDAAAAEPHEDTRQESAFQQRYIAFSNVGEASTMIPANLSGPVYEALTRIREAHGDVDEYVARELDMAVADLGKHFSPEQVDALAMTFHAHDRSLGMLLADKTGVGKGRVLAGVARRERLKGRIPIFVTLTPSLFSDYLERDVVAIGSRDKFVHPLIINDDCKTLDANGDVVVKALRRPEYKRYAESGDLPDGTDLVMLTYSQLARKRESNLTARYLLEICHRYPVSLILDESHRGAGASGTSINLEAMIEAVGTRGNVVYSSATAIKGAKNLRLYKKILPKGIDHEELLAVVQSDPLSLQEALNYEIAVQGCLISRELDDSGVERTYVVSEDLERNRAIANQVASIFSAMCFVSGDISKIVGKMNKDFEREFLKIPEDQRTGDRMAADSMNFGSRLHELNRQFLLALKARDVVQLALRALNENKKPVIAVQHTGEALLQDFMARANAVFDGDPNRVSKEAGTLIIERPVTFKDLMRKYVERISWIKVQGRYGDVDFRSVKGEEIERALERIHRLIDELPEDLPLTPLDYLRERLAEQGFRLGEVSGRNVRAATLPGGGVVIEPVPGRADKTRINRVVREFNDGDIDAIALTGSGSTGLSLQASPAVGKDVRRRTMIKWEMQPDITTERQMDGRVDRTGQIELPEYLVPLTGLPADDRLAMMFNGKNRSLTSSTVANRDSNSIIREVPDLLNEVGDMAAADILYDTEGLADALDIDLPMDAVDRAMKGALWYCNKLSGRLSLLPVERQGEVYADWQARFTEKLDQLKAEGRNPLEVECIDWKARQMSRTVFMGEAQKSDDKKSLFSSPVYLTKIEYDVEMRAVRAEEVDRRIERAVHELGGELGLQDMRIPTIVNHLQRHRDALLAAQLSKRFTTVEAALASTDPNEVKNTAAKLDWLAKNLPRLGAGAIYVEADLEGRAVPEVVIDYATPSKIEGYTRLSDYTLYTMQPGSDQINMQTLSSLFAAEINFMDQKFAHNDVVRERFDAAENGIVVRRAQLLDGNLFEATALNLRERVGRKIVYTDESGARQHGILVAAGVSAAKLERLPEKVRDPGLLLRLMVANEPITNDTAGDVHERYAVVMGRERDGFELKVPKSKAAGGHVFLDPVLSQIAGKEQENKFNLKFSEKAGKMAAHVPREQIRDLLAYLVEEKNLNFFVKDRALLRRLRENVEKSHEQAAGVV